MASNKSFTVGKQPCQNFKAQRDDNGYGPWDNRHECFAPFNGNPLCSKLVSFCESCSSDHHEDGYENCGARLFAAISAESEREAKP